MPSIFDVIGKTDDGIQEFEEKREEPMLSKAVKVTAILAGASLLLGRTGASKYLSEKRHLLARTIKEGSESFWAEGTLYSRLAGDDNKDIIGSLVGHMSKAYKENAERISKNELYNGSTFLDNVIEQLSSIPKEIKEKNIKDYKIDTALSGFNKEIKDDDTMLRLRGFLAGEYNNKTMSKEDLIEAFKEKIGLDEKLAGDVAENIKQTFARGVGKDIEDEADSLAKRFEDIAFKEMPNILGVVDKNDTKFNSVTDFMNKLGTGYKHATVEDYVKAAEEGRIKTDEKRLNFLKKMLSYGEENKQSDIYKNLRVDDNVFIKNGKIVDMRAGQDAATAFKDSMSNTLIGKILHIQPGKRRARRISQYFHRGELNPNIAHLTGAKIGESPFLRAPVIHIGNTIYSAGGNKIAEGYELGSGQYGTRARAIKRMYGISEEREGLNL
jgi:hypothetical protein